MPLNPFAPRPMPTPIGPVRELEPDTKEGLKLAHANIWEPQPQKRYSGIPVHKTVMGVDLGQQKNPSAASVLQKTVYPDRFIGPTDPRAHLIAMRRWLGEDYVKVVRDLLEYNADVMVVEYNGVGVAFIDILRHEALRLNYKGKIVPAVTAGSNARQTFHGERKGGGFIVVSKPNMIGAINVMAGWRQMVIDVKSGETAQLFKEMAEFTRNTGTGRTKVSAAELTDGSHGDLVVSLGLACWFWMNKGFRQLAWHC